MPRILSKLCADLKKMEIDLLQGSVKGGIKKMWKTEGGFVTFFSYFMKKMIDLFRWNFEKVFLHRRLIQ